MKEQSQKTSLGSEKRTCEDHGEYLSEKYNLSSGAFKREYFTACPGCEKEYEEKRKKKKEDENKKILEQRILYSGVPKRFHSCSFETYNPAKESAFNFKTIVTFCEKFDELRARGASMLLCGKPGTGKTHLSCALALFLLKSGKYVKYTTSYKMLANIKSTYSKTSIETDQDIIKKYAECDLLVIDEVGVQFGSEAEKVLFYQVINGRYENVLPSVLISNLNKDGVKDFIGERCFDRLKEGGGAILSFNWGSYRK